MKTLAFRDRHCPECRLSGQKQIEVLGIAMNSSVLLKGESSRYGKREILLFEQRENFTERKLLLLREPERFRRSFGD